MRRTVVIIGASLAGLSAARALRQRSFDGRIVLVGAERHPPYDRPPLSKDLLAGRVSSADIGLTTPEDAALDLHWRLGVRATGLDAAGRSVRLDTGEQLAADGLVLATGGLARRLAAGDPRVRVPAGVHTLRSLDDALALSRALSGAQHLVVVGAGFIGGEVAATARGLGLDVAVVEALPTPLAGVLGRRMGGVCAGLHARHGVEVLAGVPVAGLRADSGRVSGVALADGRVLPADVVLVAVGSRPAVDWLAGSGVALTDVAAEGGGVRTDAAGRTGVPGVVAVGDCASAWSPWAQRHVRGEHWTNALHQPTAGVGALLDDLAAEGPAAMVRSHQPSVPYQPPVPYFWSEQYGVRIQFAGVRRAGDEVRVVDGDVSEPPFVVLYERAGHPVAVLAMDAPRLFGRWRRRLTPPGA